jgi:hypothetical protein
MLKQEEKLDEEMIDEQNITISESSSDQFAYLHNRFLNTTKSEVLKERESIFNLLNSLTADL